MKLFKVVRQCLDERSFSICSYGIGAVEYEIGKRSYPPKGGGPLACFKTLKAARQFFPRSKIFSGQGKVSKFRKIWDPPSSTAFCTHFEDLPRGTILVDWFKPERIVSSSRESRE